MLRRKGKAGKERKIEDRLVESKFRQELAGRKLGRRNISKRQFCVFCACTAPQLQGETRGARGSALHSYPPQTTMESMNVDPQAIINGSPYRNNECS